MIYCACIHLRYTPKKWKKTKVIFIPKPGKASNVNPKAFRPISLSNYFLKTLEKLVTWKMDEAIKDNPIHEKQHGFQSNRGTESALSNTVNYIEKFIFNNKPVMGIFLDISSAFDTICPNHISRQLLKHGGDTDLVKWYPVSYTHLTLPTIYSV